MESGSIHFLHKDDPRLKLKVENRMNNIFVTQLEDAREEEENVNHIPIITETSSRLLETGVNTLQRTLVLKKQVAMDEVDRQLALKRQEFTSRMQTVAQRQAELERKKQATKERAMKFERFVEDNEVKRHRALKKYQAARKQNVLKQREEEELAEQLEELEARQQYLKNRVTEYKMYEDYLMRILDFLPENYYLGYGSESLVMPIIRRYETLSITHQDLVGRVGRLVDELEEGQNSLENRRLEHNTNRLMSNRELSQLQGEWDRAKEQNKQREMNLLTSQGLSRDQVEDIGGLLIAVRNLGEQCYIKSYGSLEEMDLLTMMDMVKEYILEMADMERRTTRLMNASSAMTSASGRGSQKNTGSKTQLKSSSKISRKSGLSS